MSKAAVDELVRNMRSSGIASKVSPWAIEGMGERQMNVRFVGLRLRDEWLEIFSEKDNLLLKFVIDRNSGYIEFYLANSTPFVKIITRQLKQGEKWETLLGEVKRRLKKDKTEFVNHVGKMGNIYERINKDLRG